MYPRGAILSGRQYLPRTIDPRIGWPSVVRIVARRAGNRCSGEHRCHSSHGRLNRARLGRRAAQRHGASSGYAGSGGRRSVPASRSSSPRTPSSTSGGPSCRPPDSWGSPPTPSRMARAIRTAGTARRHRRLRALSLRPVTAGPFRSPRRLGAGRRGAKRGRRCRH